jgi:hypothetical protein
VSAAVGAGFGPRPLKRIGATKSTLQVYMRESKVETSTEGSDLMKKLLIGAVLFTSTSALFAQGANMQTLAISEIVKTARRNQRFSR